MLSCRWLFLGSLAARADFLAVRRTFARIGAALLGLLLACGAQAFPSGPYFPLPDGATWTYSSTPLGTLTETVVGSATFNGGTVKVVRDNFGNESYYTNDAQGVRLHGQLFLDPEGNETDTFNPPVPLAAPDAATGTAVNGAGTVVAQIGINGYFIPYSSTATPVGFESVTVPAGTFANALRVQVTINYSFGEETWYQSIEVWLVPGIGIVKRTLFDSFDGSMETAELVSYHAPDIVPDAFSFAPRTVETGFTLVESDPITITGIDTPAPISITGGEYRIGAGPFVTSSGTVSYNDQVTVRVISAMPGFSTSATLNIGGVTAAFIVTTAADTSPNLFSFVPVIGAPLGLVYTSNSIFVTGINADTPISIVGGEYSISNLPFTSAPGTVCANCGVEVRVAAAASYGTTTSATLTIGGVSAAFLVTTLVPSNGPFWQLFFASDSGDYIGEGRTKLFQFGPAHPETTFSVTRNFRDGISVHVAAPDLSFWWYLDLDAPGSAALVPGRYKGALRFPFNDDAAGLDFYGDGRGCNLLTGRFDVLDVAYAPGGAVQRLAVNFEQHCESSPRALFGEVRVNSAVPLGSNVVRRTVVDSNGDGHSDIFWRNLSTGENYLYPMSGTQILAGEGYLRSVADLNWKIAGIGDFDGDGFADVLWRNSSTGENYVYLMNGLSIVNEGYLRTVPDQSWQVAGVGDFDGDGKDDILWRNPVKGENYVYPMDGLAIRPAEGYLRTVADPGWKVVAVADFDGDGKADVLWRHSSSGENYLYPMNGTFIKATEGFVRTVADTTWEVKGAGDLDGDGKADIVWRNSASGENYVYPMDGATIRPGEAYLRTVADTNWRIVALGDYDGDGKSDILWRNASSGENYLYPMDGTAIKPSEGYLRTVPPGAWTIVGR